MADRARNQANYLAHKRLATIDFWLSPQRPRKSSTSRTPTTTSESAAGVTSKLNGKCSTADRKKRKAAKQAVGIGKGESIDVPLHLGWADQVLCRLEFLLSEQADFKEQQNAIQELVLSRGHFCVFLPKFHLELNFIERYWSRVK